MTRLDDRSLPAFGAFALLVLSGGMFFGLNAGFAAFHAALHDVSFATALGRIHRDLPILTLIQLGSMGTALVVGLRMFDPETPPSEALMLRPVRPLTLGACLLAGACLQLPLTELTNVLRVLDPMPLEQQIALQSLIEAHTFIQGVIAVSCLAAIAPLIEELLFRGLFLFGLQRRYGSGFALILSSCFFGIAHWSAVPAVVAGLAGVVLARLALATRSLWPGVAVHGAFNALPVLLPERAVPIEGFNVPSEAPVHLAPWLVWPALLVGSLLLVLAVRLEVRGEAT